MLTTESKKKFITDFVFWALVAVIAYLFFKYVFSWFAPFIIGFAFAALANHFAKKLVNRFKFSRKFSSTILNLLFLVIIAAALWGIIYLIYQQVAKFVTERVIEGDIVQQLTATITSLAAKIPENFRSELIELSKTALSSLASGLTGIISRAVTATPGILLGTLIAIIASFIFSGDFPRIAAFLKVQLPEKWQKTLPIIQDSMKNSILRLIKAYLVIICITFAELSIGLLILGEPYAGAIAAITAIIDILPVFGTGFVLWPWTVISLINGKYVLAAGLLILYLVIQVVRQIIEPRLVGHSIGMHPIVTLMAMYVGSRIMGVMGIFVFPIILIVVKNLQDNGYIKLWSTLPKEEKETRKAKKRKSVEDKGAEN